MLSLCSHRLIQALTGSYRLIQALTCSYRLSQAHTGSYRLIRAHTGSQELTGVLLNFSKNMLLTSHFVSGIIMVSKKPLWIELATKTQAKQRDEQRERAVNSSCQLEGSFSFCFSQTARALALGQELVYDVFTCASRLRVLSSRGRLWTTQEPKKTRSCSCSAIAVFTPEDCPLFARVFFVCVCTRFWRYIKILFIRSPILDMGNVSGITLCCDNCYCMRFYDRGKLRSKRSAPTIFFTS